MAKTFIFFGILCLFFIGCQSNDGQKVFTNKGTSLEEGFEEIISENDSPERVVWQKPELVLEKLGNLNGKVVADLGAGTGYFSFRLLSKADKVIALDIDPRAIKILDSLKLRLPATEKKKLETRLTPVSKANLKNGEADIVLCVNTYTYIENRVGYFSTLLKILNKGAILLIVDYKKKQTPTGPKLQSRIDLFQIETELTQAGFTLVESDDTSLEYQYIVKVIKP